MYKDLFNANGNGGISPKTVTEWFYLGVKEYHALPALHYNGQSLSYGQLDMLSNRIANYLSGRSIKRGNYVGICLDRSPEMIACIIGILKAGAAYVPLDPHYPIDRLQMMREDARITLLICHAKHVHRFNLHSDSTIVWEKKEDVIKQYSDSPLNIKVSGEDVAYVIFTSGSTGRSKGITMPHRALANLIAWQLHRPYFLYKRKVLQYSSISFDVSFQEIATTLASGGTLFLIKDEERRDPRLLLKVLQDHKIERLFMPFVALHSMVSVAIRGNTFPQSLRECITAGEQLRVDADLRSFFMNLPETILENQYGPSESHVISAYLLSDNPSEWRDLPPIGKPLTGNEIYILDRNMKPVAEGETGELYLGGVNLAHGYIGQNALTKNAFIKNPLLNSHHPILYRTGDLGYYNSDGDIEFLGRADHQIKMRGYRIEPEEINVAGAKYPGILQCFTNAMQDASGETQLITYYKTDEDKEVKREKFKAFLAKALPEYMNPAFVIQILEIPFTPSGKVDLKALPKPDEQLEKEPFDVAITYQNETEERLAKIWYDILKLKIISRTANFFDLGGNSINAVILFMEIEEHFNKYLPLSTLAQAPTIESLATIINGEKTALDHTKFRSLQIMHPVNGKRAPLFLVHGGGGNILVFKDFVDVLPPEQPVYAFQWSGWDGYKGEEDIMAMARAYKNELRRACPNGPYRLGGHCIGGIIAVEIANLLKAEGAEVLDPLLVSDAPNLYSKYYHPEEPERSEESKKAFNQAKQRLDSEILKYAARHAEEPKGESKKVVVVPNSYAVRRYPALAKVFPFYVSLAKAILKAQYHLKVLRIFIRKNLSLKISATDRELYCEISQLQAIKKHKKSIYNGDMLYFKTEEFYGRKLGLQGWWEDSFFGFEELCAGRFEGYIVGGGHNDMLKKASVQEIIRERMFAIDD